MHANAQLIIKYTHTLLRKLNGVQKPAAQQTRWHNTKSRHYLVIWQDIAGKAETAGEKNGCCYWLRSARRWPTVVRIPEAKLFFQHVCQTPSLAFRVNIRVNIRVNNRVNIRVIIRVVIR